MDKVDRLTPFFKIWVYLDFILLFIFVFIRDGFAFSLQSNPEVLYSFIFTFTLFVHLFIFLVPLFVAIQYVNTHIDQIKLLLMGIIVLSVQVVVRFISTSFAHVDCGDQCVATIIPQATDLKITQTLIIVGALALIAATVITAIRIKKNTVSKTI